MKEKKCSCSQQWIHRTQESARGIVKKFLKSWQEWLHCEIIMLLVWFVEGRQAILLIATAVFKIVGWRVMAKGHIYWHPTSHRSSHAGLSCCYFVSMLGKQAEALIQAKRFSKLLSGHTSLCEDRHSTTTRNSIQHSIHNNLSQEDLHLWNPQAGWEKDKFVAPVINGAFPGVRRNSLWNSFNVATSALKRPEGVQV